MNLVDWVERKPRKGLAGHWDRFIGPGATSAEEWVQLAGGLAIGAGAFWLYWSSHGSSAGWLATLLLLVLCLDLGGGIVTNATASAKRWYHREGQGWPQHLLFVAVHGVHIGFVAFAFAAQGIWFFTLTFGLLMAASAVILAVPLYLQRPVAMTAYALALLAGQTGPLQVPGLEWFVPLLFLKLLISHLLMEAPFAAGNRP